MPAHLLELDLSATGFGTVKLDGRDLNCRRIMFAAAVEELSTVTIELVNVDVLAKLAVDEPTVVDVTTTADVYRKRITVQPAKELVE